ncbi:hypothetical protein ACSLNA_26035, partial [Escherichia coli]
LVQFILVQVLVRTNDGGRQAVREYIVITDELRDTLSRQSHATALRPFNGGTAFFTASVSSGGTASQVRYLDFMSFSGD